MAFASVSEREVNTSTAGRRRRGGGERVDCNYKTGVANEYFMCDHSGCLFSSLADEPADARVSSLSAQNIRNEGVKNAFNRHFICFYCVHINQLQPRLGTN